MGQRICFAHRPSIYRSQSFGHTLADILCKDRQSSQECKCKSRLRSILGSLRSRRKVMGYMARVFLQQVVLWIKQAINYTKSLVAWKSKRIKYKVLTIMHFRANRERITPKTSSTLTNRIVI